MILAPGRPREHTSSLRPSWAIQQGRVFSFPVFTCPPCHIVQVKCVLETCSVLSHLDRFSFPFGSDCHLPLLVFSQHLQAQAMGSENFWVKLVCTVVAFVSPGGAGVGAAGSDLSSWKWISGAVHSGLLLLLP